MKRQGNRVPWNINEHTTEDLIDSVEDEILMSELKVMMISMNNEMKEDIHKW
jgi:hypothetical protein